MSKAELMEVTEALVQQLQDRGIEDRVSINLVKEAGSYSCNKPWWQNALEGAYNGVFGIDPSYQQSALKSAGDSDRTAALRTELELLKEELNWSQYYYYADFADASDFTEMSGYVPQEEKEPRALDIMLDNYSSDAAPWEDPLYEYINGNEEAGAWISNAGANYYGSNNAIGAIFGRATESKTESQQMTEQEVATFNYLYATQGKAAAYAYYDYLLTDLNYRQRKTDEEYWAGYAARDPVGSSVLSVVMSPTKGLSYIGQLTDYIGDGEIDQNAAYNKFAYTNSAIRGQVVKQIEESGKWGKVGSFAYQTGLSMADFLLNTAITGGNQATTLAIMGSGAAADTTIAAKDRGLTDTQSFWLGTIAGAAEIITEKVSLETLLNPDLLKNGAKKYILKNMLAEGSEEVGSDLINLIADILITKDQSEWQASIEHYTAQGKTYAEAFGLAIAGQAVTMGLDFLGGAISGGVMSGVNAGIHVNYTNQMAGDLGKLNLDGEDIQAFIETGLESDPETASHQLAVEMQTKIEAGEALSNYDLARLYQANMQAIQEEEATEDLPDDTIIDDDQAEEVAGDVTGPEGLSLPSVENDTRAPGFVSQNTQNGTQAQVNDTALPSGVPLSIADQLRQEQAQNGGVQYENTYERAAGPATAKPTGELYAPGRTGLSDGSAERNAGAGTAEQTGVLAGSPEQRRSAWTDRRRATVARQNYARSLRLEKVSSLDLGLQNGTEARNIQVMPQEHWDAEMSQLADRIHNETGKGVTYVMGRIQIRGSDGTVDYARGVIIGDRIIVQADNLRIPMEQIADHEAYHAKVDFTGGRLNAEIKRHIIETFSEEQFRQVLDKYIEGLRGVIDVSEARTGEEFEAAMRQIEEEIFADAYAGINAFGAGADQFTDAVNERMDQLNMGKIRNQDNGTEKPTGPPNDDRYSIETLSDGKKYVRADRQVIFGNDPDSWSEQVEDYINGRIRRGQDVTLIAEDGDVLTITSTTAGKLADNHTGRGATMPDEDFYVKSNAAVHIDELSQISTRGQTKKDLGSRHGEFASEGWNYRTAFFQDFDGRYYKLQISVAQNEQGNVVYNIGRIEERSSPTIYGSSAKGGALGGKTSFEKSVPQADRTVKQRFSYAGENANNADMDALARAKEMQAAGVADETIRQQTGWYTGMDGKWRWEIDDSGMRYDSSGDLRGSESAKWARDVAQRREFNAQQRRETIPNRGDDRTVFAEETGLSPDMDNQGEVERIGKADIKAIQSIGRMSVNQFSQADKRATERFARMYWRDIGAKSPFFRTWFGDWRGNDQTAVRVANQRGDSRGTCNNEDTGWNIQVSGKVFHETMNHSAKKNRSAQSYLPYINDIVKKAILLDSFAMGLGKEKSANSLMMHSLYAVADNGSGPNLIKLYVEEMYDPNQRGTAKRAYQLQNIEISSLTGDNNTESSGLALASFETADVHSVADLFAAVKSRDESFRPNPQSQVVNEDGSPKIVYHGTNQTFNTFASQNGAYWFSESEDYAESMMEERGGGEVKQAYLNMRNPYRATLDPGRFSDLSYEAPILRKAKAEGYDGVIIENSSKDPLVADTFYVVFDPRQIKSATDNVGTFDGMNPDIRYSVDDGGQDSAQQRISRLMEQYQIAQARGDTEQMNTLNNQLRRALGEVSPRKKATPRKTRPVAESLPLTAKKDLRNTVLNLFSIPNGQRAEVGTMIDSYADRLIKNGSLTEDDRKAFFDRMYDSGVMVMPAEEYSAFARSHIADGRIYVSDSVKADFGDDWADIRRRAFAAGVYLVNDRTASGIDQWNATLSAEDMLPGLFDSEETDERTILERIIQVAEEGKDEHLSLAEYTRRLSQQEGISEDEFLDNMERQLDWALRTFAEKASLEVHLRDRTGRKIAQEREKGNQRMTRRQAKEVQRRANERQARKDSARRAKERRELRELQQRTLKQLQWLSRNRNRAPEAFAQGTTVRMAPETVKAIVSDLTPQELELARLLEQYYNSFATQEINRVSNILYGYDKAMGKNYAPIYTNRNYTKTEFGVFDTTAEGVGNLKGRRYAVNPSYNISAFDAFERHVDQTARFCGMAIPTRNWKTLMNWQVSNNSTADVITHKWGEEGEKYITDLITTLQEGGGSKSDVVQSGIEKLRSNYISAVFGANPSIVLKQLGSIPLAAAYLDAKNFPSVRQISGIDRQLISQYTQDLEWRTMGYSMPETKTLKDNPNWTQSNKVANFFVGGGAITAMDGWAASVLWPWAENKVSREFPELSRGNDTQIQNGQSPFYQKVAEEFENAVARSQSTSDEIHQGTLRKSKNPFTQVFTMFRSDSAQTYNVLRQKIGEAQYYARTGADVKTIRTARKAVGTAAVAALVGYVWAEAVELLMNLWKHKGKSYRDDDGELTAESIAGEMVSGMVGDIAGVVVGGEELYDFLGSLLTDGTPFGIETMGLEQLNDCAEAMWYAGRGLLDVFAEGADILKNGGDLGEYFRRHGNEMLGGIKDIANTAAMYIFGFPAENLEKYLLGGIKWLAPELQARYEDLLNTPGKTGLSGLNGDALAARVGDIIDNRGITASEETARALAQLYEAGEKAAFFSDTPDSISIDGEKRILSAYQQQTYDKVWTSIVSDGLDELVGTSTFAEGDNGTRAKMLSNLYAYAAERAKAELFDEYEMDSGAAKNAEIVAAGASVAECITWNTITSKMKSGEKAAELAAWDIPEEAKQEIFRSKISDSREDSIAAFDEAGLSFDQFLQAYSMYGQINNEDMNAGMKAVEFSHWVNAQGYTAEQAAVIKDELTYFNMTPASSSRYDELVGSGMDPDDAYDLTGALNELQPEDGEDEVSDLQKWRASVDFSDDVDDQLAALSAVMTDAQFQKVEIANDFGVSPDTYVTLQEIKPQYDADGNGSYKQKEIQAAIDGLPGYYTTEQKAVLWQLATGSTSSRNNPYSRQVGQQVLDARAAAKEAAAQEQTETPTDNTDDDSFSQELLNQLLGRG